MTVAPKLLTTGDSQLDTALGNPDQMRDLMIRLFESKRDDLKSNTDYYESNHRPTAVGVATPPKLQELLSNIGYPRLYVNAVSDRLELEGFRLGNASQSGSKPSQASTPSKASDGQGNPIEQQLWDWWTANFLDVESILGHTEALVHGRSYITVAAPDPKTDFGVDLTVPIIRVEPPTNLYAVTDPRTRQVTVAIRAIYGAEGTNQAGRPVAATLYLTDQTVSWVKQDDWTVLSAVKHGLGIVPVIPLANRTRLSDLYGTSDITPELRSVTDAAARIMMNMQTTAELMAVPQRLLFGVKKEELGVDPATGQTQFDAYLARILAFTSPEAKAEQFSAAELRNFTEALQELAKQAAAYTGLPPQYLSSQSDNPASAEAIKASESRLVKNAERKAKVFGSAWEQAMRVAYKVMNPGGDIPPEMYRMESVWRDPSTPTYAAKADAAVKLYANGIGVIPRERARIDMGYTIVEREEMTVWDKEENPVVGALGAITNPAAPAAQKTASAAKPTATTTQSPQT